jgi:putative MFS transporter
MQHVGIHSALGVCVGVLVFGGVFCHVFAPETGTANLSDMRPGQSDESKSATGGEHGAALAALSDGSRK